MHKLTSRAGAIALAVIAAAAIAADKGSIEAQVGGVEVIKKDPPPQDAKAQPPKSNCMTQCTTRDVKCGSEVRRSRQECSRHASTGGRDPMTMRSNDYTYFCGHFSNPGIHCGSDYYTSSCTARFQHRYGVCLDTMQNNIAAMRYDCFKAEREAQRLCREELQDCKRACGG